MRRSAVLELGGALELGPASRPAQRGHTDPTWPTVPRTLWRAERRKGRQEGSISDEESWHDWAHQGVAPGQEGPEPPSVAPGAARAAGRGARQCAGAILYGKLALGRGSPRLDPQKNGSQASSGGARDVERVCRSGVPTQNLHSRAARGGSVGRGFSRGYRLGNAHNGFHESVARHAKC